VEHRFLDITEDLEVLVIFAPAETVKDGSPDSYGELGVALGSGGRKRC
jgi:hypothetical protein